jgi:hypothetical protein
MRGNRGFMTPGNATGCKLLSEWGIPRVDPGQHFVMEFRGWYFPEMWLTKQPCMLAGAYPGTGEHGGPRMTFSDGSQGVVFPQMWHKNKPCWVGHTLARACTVDPECSTSNLTMLRCPFSAAR